MNIKTPPSVTFLVGLPCSGKSTYVETHMPEHFVVSMDTITEAIGKIFGFTYNDMFEKPNQSRGLNQPASEKFGKSVPQPIKWKTWQPFHWDLLIETDEASMLVFDLVLRNAAKRSKVVVDMTNMSVNARKRTLSFFESFEKKAIVWKTSVEDSIERSNKRYSQTGEKYIPSDAIQRMASSFQEPTSEEGFTTIIYK